MSTTVILKRPITANGGLCQIGSRVRVPDRYATALEKQGAAVIVADKKKAEKPKPEPKPSVSSMTKAELLEACENLGIEANDSMTKAELVELLKQD